MRSSGQVLRIENMAKSADHPLEQWKQTGDNSFVKARRVEGGGRSDDEARRRRIGDIEELRLEE